MIKHQFLTDEGILIISPVSSLHSRDFDTLSHIIDPYIAKHGTLNGLIIYTQSFPGWQNFTSMLAHVKFVRDHHAKIQKVAAVADEGIISVLPAIASHFVKAEVKHFDHDELDNAIEWVMQD